MATQTAAALPQPPVNVVSIANARRERQLRDLRLKLERGKTSLTQRSMQARMSGYSDPAGMLAMSQQANDEIEQTMNEIESLSDRDLVLRLVPESPESDWTFRRPPM